MTIHPTRPRRPRCRKGEVRPLATPRLLLRHKDRLDWTGVAARGYHTCLQIYQGVGVPGDESASVLSKAQSLSPQRQ